MKPQKTQIAKTHLGKKNGIGRINFPDFRLYYKIIILQTILQSHSHLDSMTLAKTMIIDQDRKS